MQIIDAIIMIVTQFIDIIFTWYFMPLHLFFRIDRQLEACWTRHCILDVILVFSILVYSTYNSSPASLHWILGTIKSTVRGLNLHSLNVKGLQSSFPAQIWLPLGSVFHFVTQFWVVMFLHSGTIFTCLMVSTSSEQFFILNLFSATLKLLYGTLSMIISHLVNGTISHSISVTLSQT